MYIKNLTENRTVEKNRVLKSLTTYRESQLTQL
jgi:hypothetical protein